MRLGPVFETVFKKMFYKMFPRPCRGGETLAMRGKSILHPEN
jgi:hypothetical protein